MSKHPHSDFEKALEDLSCMFDELQDADPDLVVNVRDHLAEVLWQ